jgi:hypothetical protein
MTVVVVRGGGGGGGAGLLVVGGVALVVVVTRRVVVVFRARVFVVFGGFAVVWDTSCTESWPSSDAVPQPASNKSTVSVVAVPVFFVMPTASADTR